METIKKCPKCGSLSFVKHGIIKNKQRYKCKQCNYHFTVAKMGKRIDKELVVRSIQLYLEGIKFRAIERILGVSHVSVINWVKSLSKDIEDLRKPESKEVKVVKIDELCSYVKEKKTRHGYGLLMIEIGNKFLVCM